MTAKIVLKRHDTLGKHGYKDVKTLTKDDRHRALLRAIAEFGTTYVIRKLNVLAIYNKNKNPSLSKLFRDDIRFVQKFRDEARAIHSAVNANNGAPASRPKRRRRTSSRRRRSKSRRR
jgi:hypothetical protein